MSSVCKNFIALLINVLYSKVILNVYINYFRRIRGVANILKERVIFHAYASAHNKLESVGLTFSIFKWLSLKGGTGNRGTGNIGESLKGGISGNL